MSTGVEIGRGAYMALSNLQLGPSVTASLEVLSLHRSTAVRVSICFLYRTSISRLRSHPQLLMAVSSCVSSGVQKGGATPPPLGMALLAATLMAEDTALFSASTPLSAFEVLCLYSVRRDFRNRGQYLPYSMRIAFARVLSWISCPFQVQLRPHT